ncbi:hypothetical protein NQ314_003870 [Rhamnusium bicolor]|uniref:Transposase Tc1-like domain-containing protein n=1 Tax=Rhamnusium bicolor TaxID=1586634 RepID=A0AAV8ZM31_9CUCU|nr:hypothetical protein NQ314_003870 [Rhamnusium bicolor]
MRETCDKEKCKLKCTEHITGDDRFKIHKSYWNSDFNTDQKRQFIAASVEEFPIKRRRERTGTRTDKRQTTLHYSFIVRGTKQRVCQKYFLNTLDISQTTIRNILRKRQDGGMVESDKREKHVPANKLSDEMRIAIRNHIQRFPCLESHYSRNRSKKKYLGGELNISRMYSLFKDECLQKDIREAEIPKQWVYTDIFNTEFNLSFKAPATDICDLCDEFIIKLKGS